MWHRTLSTFFAVWVCSAFLCCKSDPPASPEQPETPIQVTLSFKVYNHTQGFIKDFTRNVMSGSEVKIWVSELALSGVDPLRLAVRKDRMGELIGSSWGGFVTFWAPRESQTYTVYLMNDTGKYSLIDYWKYSSDAAGVLVHPRAATWHLENRNDPKYHISEDVADAVMNQFHEAINHPWGSYGELKKVASGGNFSIGGGKCTDNPGQHSAWWAGVNPIVTTNTTQPHTFTVKGMLYAEIFELLTQTKNLGGPQYGTYDQLTDGENLTQIGIDLLNYVYLTSK